MAIKNFAPSYQILFWNEKSLNVHENKYTSLCYKKKWYVHLSDYFRIEVVWKHGGIYLDIDLLIKPIKDSFIEYPSFPYEDFLINGKLKRLYGSGWGFSSFKKSLLLREILDSYERFDIKAINFDLSIPTWADLTHQTPIIEKYINEKLSDDLESWNFVPLSLLSNFIKTLNFASWMTQEEIIRSKYIVEETSKSKGYKFSKTFISIKSYVRVYGLSKGLMYIINRTVSLILLKINNKKN